MKKNKVAIITFLTPAVFMFMAVFFYPIIRTVIMSFCSIDSVTAPMSEWTFSGVSNYTRLATTGLFITAMKNIGKIWIIGGAAVMTLSLLFGTILTSGIRGKKFFRAVIYLPNIVSAVALATMWLQYVYSAKFGLFKSIFETLGMEKAAAYEWLATDNKFNSLLIAYCFGMVGYHMLIWMSGIERIGPEYYEAAKIDGANRVMQFRYITFPLLKGVAKTNLTMWSVSTSAFFVWSQLFSMVTAGESTIVPVQYMYSQVFGSGNSATVRDAGYAAAIGVVLCICVVLAFRLINFLIKDDDLEF